MNKLSITITTFIIILGFIGILLVMKQEKGTASISPEQEITKQNRKEVSSTPVSTTENPTQDLQQENNTKSNTVKRKKITTSEKLKVERPTMIIDINKVYTAVIKTSVGDIKIKLNTTDTPVTTNNFIYLSKIGFYDNTIFHRVIDGFMIQGGDPLGNGTGGPSYKFEDEISDTNSNKRGTISMANSGPNTNGSQFFINQADNDFLDTKHTVFGEVVDGMPIVDKIAKSQVGQNDKPIKDITIKEIIIIEQ